MSNIDEAVLLKTDEAVLLDTDETVGQDLKCIVGCPDLTYKIYNYGIRLTRIPAAGTQTPSLHGSNLNIHFSGVINVPVDVSAHA